jgi:hypothetical protein
MTHVQVSSDIRRWLHNDKRSLIFYLAICSEFRLEESLLFPPRIPGGFNGDGIISFVMRVIERFDD